MNPSSISIDEWMENFQKANQTGILLAIFSVQFCQFHYHWILGQYVKVNLFLYLLWYMAGITNYHAHTHTHLYISNAHWSWQPEWDCSIQITFEYFWASWKIWQNELFYIELLYYGCITSDLFLFCLARRQYGMMGNLPLILIIKDAE